MQLTFLTFHFGISGVTGWTIAKRFVVYDLALSVNSTIARIDAKCVMASFVKWALVI